MHGTGYALDHVLARLLAGTGARAVRVVDGAGVVVAASPMAGALADNPVTVARLVGEAVGLGRGGIDDVLVTTASAVHLLRPVAAPGTFLHLVADLHVDAARARRMLADPALHLAVHSALEVQREPRPTPRNATPPDATPPDATPPSAIPAQRSTHAQRPARPRHRFAGDRTGELPALAGLRVQTGRYGIGIQAAAAVEALTGQAAGTGLAAEPRPVTASVTQIPPAPIPLPRRSPAAGLARVADRAAPRKAAAGLPDRAWAGDLDTMRRLLVGLRRLA